MNNLVPVLGWYNTAVTAIAPIQNESICHEESVSLPNSTRVSEKLELLPPMQLSTVQKYIPAIHGPEVNRQRMIRFLSIVMLL